jgi:glutathionyl-hydroquinone reductase
MTDCLQRSTGWKQGCRDSDIWSEARSPKPIGVSLPTLVRFDVAYFSLFKCNRQRIADFPNLSNYMRELYRVPGVADTVKPRYYVINYYSIAKVNPTQIIPKGTPVDFSQPHDRAKLAA